MTSCQSEYNLCDKQATKEELEAFQKLLDKADEENGNMFDQDILIDLEDAADIDSSFYLCEDCIEEIKCANCDKLLPRCQIKNFYNSNDVNHLNEGLCMGPAGCTDCWLKWGEEDDSSSSESQYETTCYYCDKNPTKKELEEFQTKLTKVKDHKYDEKLGLSDIKETNVSIDEEFFVCDTHRSTVSCVKCKNRLSKDQLRAFLNTEDHNTIEGKAACTDCWIRNDESIRLELGIQHLYVHCYFCARSYPRSTRAPAKKYYDEFQEKLDKADETNGNEHDKDLMWDGDYSEVGKDFYVCKKHMEKVTCDECHRLMTRHQIDNAIHSQKGDHYNLFREGPRHMDFGKELKPACTDCWIKYDSDLREELGIEEGEDSEYEYPPLPPSPSLV